jgi:RNA polymerase sigma factor (sigma-70 family)
MASLRPSHGVTQEPGQRSGATAPAGIDVTRIAHDPDAFEAFYRSHLEPVQRFIARRVGDPYLAADLTADVFLAAIDSADSYRPGRGTSIGWLLGVARNVIAAAYRQSARERRAASRIPPAAELVEAVDLDRLHQRIDAETERRRLYLAMDRLLPGERAVLELVALDGLAVQEAARALEILPATARVRLHRARRRMRTELARDETEGTPRLTEASG